MGIAVRDFFTLTGLHFFDFLAQPRSQFFYRLAFFKMQNGGFLPALVLDKRGQCGHGAVAVGQYFAAHDGVDGGGFAGFHGAHHGQHHFKFFGFAPVFGQYFQFFRYFRRREKAGGFALIYCRLSIVDCISESACSILLSRICSSKLLCRSISRKASACTSSMEKEGFMALGFRVAKTE